MLINNLDFRLTSGACPEQYDVFNGDKQVGYVRLRGGWLRCDIPDCGGDTIFEAYPNGADGMFKSDEQRDYYLKKIAKKIGICQN